MECEAPKHTYLVLTKRPERAYDILRCYHKVSNIWLGVTAENQEQADKRIPVLLQIPAAVRFVSVEPMLSKTDLSPYLEPTTYTKSDGGRKGFRRVEYGLDWVICGAETGPGARLMDTLWALDLRDQCQKAGVPFFFKGWGNNYGSIEYTMPMERP